MCVLTVFMLMPRVEAISAFDLPWVSSSMTCCSLMVNVLGIIIG
jgi:hypothetical protein